MSKRGLQDLERSVRQRPRRDTAELLADALGLSALDRAAFFEVARRRSSPAESVSRAALPTMFSMGARAPLVGRERELLLLSQFLAVQSEVLPAPSVLLLAGEPGIGKTHLLQALARQAAAAGWCVLTGGSRRRGGEEPYVPLIDALAMHIRALSPQARREALVGCIWLGRLLPELEAPVLATLSPEQERRLMYEAVGRFLTNVAGPAGTLLLLDDLQWAGPDALDLVHTLAGVSGLPLRIVGAYRDTETQPADPLNVLLSDLAQARLIRRVPLGPLDTQDASTLLAELLAGIAEEHHAPAERALERAGGVPFFLVSYAQALHQGSTEGAPWDLAQGVRQRVALLPEAARQLLGVASIIGRQVPRVLLAAAAGQSEEDVLPALEAACRARLLVEEGAAGYVFAHDVIREVLEADVGAARRALLHRKVAVALEGASVAVRPELLAHHYIWGGDQGKAVQYLELAGDRAWSERAYTAAADQYGEAVTRLEQLGRAPDAVRVREKLGEVLYGAGRYEAALRVLEQAAAAYDLADDMEGLVRVTAALGWAHRFWGTTPRGISLITALLERLERGDASSPPLATLYQALGWLQFTAGRYDASLTAGERAAALARAAGDDRTLALAEGHRINILQMLGRIDEALRVGKDAMLLAERVGDLTCLIGIYGDVAHIHDLQGAFATSRRCLDLALARSEELGNPTLVAYTLGRRGWCAVLSGDWASARVDLDQAAAVSSRTGRSWFSDYLPIFQARLSLAEGEWAIAIKSARRALVLAEKSGDLQALRWASGVMAELNILGGRAEAAEARLVPLLDRPGMQECDVTMFLPVLAWAYLEIGRLDQAVAAVEQALARARPEGMRLVVVEALRIRAMVALRLDQWEAAARSLDEGLTLARAMPYPYAEARLLQVEGALHARKGEPETARERLEAARIIFTRLGARMSLERGDQSLVALFQPGVHSR
jgi:tetratricopeptide (TPR) repeat protein